MKEPGRKQTKTLSFDDAMRRVLSVKPETKSKPAAKKRSTKKS